MNVELKSKIDDILEEREQFKKSINSKNEEIKELHDVCGLLKQEIYQKVVKISELEDKNDEITQCYFKKIKDLEKKSSLHISKPNHHEPIGKPSMGMGSYGMQNGFDKKTSHGMHPHQVKKI